MVKYQADRAFKALADSTRRDILERLTLQPLSITELADPYGLSLPGVMKHVRILEEARLLTSEKRGRTRECRLGPKRLDEVAQWVEWYRGQWERRLDRLESAIATTRGDTS